jgi:NADH-ubiquinone oxidoreductase chain 4
MAGYVILAGISSKLKVHKFLRFSILMCSEATLFSTTFIYTPSVIAIIYTRGVKMDGLNGFGLYC